MHTLDRRPIVLWPGPPAALAMLLRFGRSDDPAVEVSPTHPSLGNGVADAGDSPHARRADRVVREVDQQHGQGLLGLAIRSGLAHDAAEDAVQEALFRLWQEVRRGVEVIDPRAWTFRTLYRIAMDEHRFRRRAGDIVARLSTRSWKTLDPDIAQRISVWTLVDQLPTRQRQVLYLRFKADLSFDQIAATLGITASAARAHATFAAARLRAAIGEEWER
jgi:RNA polymerase sigma factor (sigma-70 family)